MRFLRRAWLDVILLFVIALTAAARLYYYGDLRLSVANSDTQSYINSSNYSIFSWNSLIGERLFTTNLLYHLSGVNRCQLLAISYPAIQSETHRELQPCFDKIALLQNLLSVIGWAGLAGVVVANQSSWFGKVLAAVVIPLFGYSPPIADWDSILGSESLTFSLFGLSLGILILIAFQHSTENDRRKSLVYGWCLKGLGILVFTAWAFTRDANIYVIVVLFIFTISLMFIARFRKRKDVFIIGLVLAGLIVIGMRTSFLSGRWRVPLQDVFDNNILPYSSRLDYFINTGMPKPDSPAYQDWFRTQAPAAYSGFLLTHPGYVLTSIGGQMQQFFLENMQPYFKDPEVPARDWLVALGDVMHPKSSIVLAIDCILLLALLTSLFQENDVRTQTWCWLSGWLFLSATAILLISFFGDTVGINRHILLPIELYRLFLWLFLILVVDQFLIRRIPFGEGEKRI